MASLSLPTWLRYSWWGCCAILYIAVFFVYATRAYNTPSNNWDMIAYIGVVVSFTEHTPEAIYDTTMAAVKPVYSKDTYENLLHKSPLTNSARAFYQQLPLYSIKPLYTGLLWTISQLGYTLYEASYIACAFAFMLLGVIAYIFIPRGWDGGLWWLAILAYCTLNPWSLNELSRWVTPDMLSIALMLAAFCGWFYAGSFTLFALCAWLAQLTRPDNLLLILSLCVYFHLVPIAKGGLSRKQATAVALAAIALYIIVNTLAGNYGIATLYSYSFIKKMPFPAETAHGLSISIVLDMLLKGFIHFYKNPHVVIFFILTVLTVLLNKIKPLSSRSCLWLIATVWATLLLRFSIFPAWWENRYYYSYYLLLLYGIAEAVAPYAHWLRQLLCNRLAAHRKG